MSGSTRIAIDARMLSQEQCHGIGRVIIEFVKRFPPARPGDAEVVVILAEGRSSKFDLDPLIEAAEVVYSTSAIGRPYDVADLRRQLKRLDAGVMFAPYHALAPVAIPCDLVVGVHDCILESDIRLSGGWWRSMAYRANTERVLRGASAVVVPSESTRALLPAYYTKVPPVHVCPNGVDPVAWSAREEETERARGELRLPGRYVLNIGARRPHKNQAVVIEALTHMDDDVDLVLVGDHDPRVPDKVDEAVARFGLEGRVRQLSRLRDYQLRGIYGGAELFAFPSIAEGFGLPPLEAMSAGVPVVASAVPVVAEVCRDAAVYASPFNPEHWADALTWLLKEPEAQDRLRARGTEIAAATTWEPGAQRLYDLLQQAAFTGGKRR